MSNYIKTRIKIKGYTVYEDLHTQQERDALAAELIAQAYDMGPTSAYEARIWLMDIVCNMIGRDEANRAIQEINEREGQQQ